MINIHSLEDDGLLTSFSQRHKVFALALSSVFVGYGNATTKALADVEEAEPLTTFRDAYKEYIAAISANQPSSDYLVSIAEQTFQLGRAKFGPRHQNTFMLQQNLANAHLVAGDYSRSAVNYASVIEFYDDTQGDESQAYYFALLDIINLLHTAYKAKKLAAEDLGLTQFTRDKAIVKLLSVTRELVSFMPENALLFLGHTVKTVVSNRWAEKNSQLLNMAKKFSIDAKKYLGESSPVYVESLVYLGQVLYGLQKNKDALITFDKALSLPQSQSQDMRSFRIVAHAHLASLFARKNNAEKAGFYSQSLSKERLWDGEKVALHRVMPRFPSAKVAKTDTNKASVILTFDINENGQAINIHTAKSSHEGFNKFAITALKQWYFAPKCVDGEFSTAMGFSITIDFIRE